MRGPWAGGGDPSGDFVIVGVDRYDHPELSALPGVARDVDMMVRLLTDLGFERTQSHLGAESTADEVRRALDGWMEQRSRRSVLYWAGHAVIDRDELVLLLKGSNPYRWTLAYALTASELARNVALSAAEEVLLVVDTCHAGGAAPAFFERLWRALDEQRDSNRRVWLLAAASAADVVAEDDDGGELVRTLDRLIRAGAPATARPYWTQNDEYIRVEDLSRALEELHPELAIRPELSGRRPLSREFLRNLGYQPDAPEQTEAEARERRLNRSEAESHFWPSSRGVEVGETGWHFTGRERLLTHLVGWLHSGAGPRLQVVSGSPGAGKSALLGRLATLSDPNYRKSAEDEGVLADARPETIPELGAIRLSILLRGKTLDDCLRRVAAGFGFEIDADKRPIVADILAELEAHGSRDDVILLDALDEATDPNPIADFIRQLAHRRRVLLGTRRNWGRGSGLDADDLGPLLKRLRLDRQDVIFLDDDVHAAADIDRYVRRRLADPTIDCAYQWDAAATDAAARAIAEHANGVFRLARDWCRLLCREPEALRPGSERFSRLLREGSDGVFSRELARFGGEERRAFELLSALAWSEGLGLPRQVIWPVVATAIAGLSGGSGNRYELADAIWALEQAGSLIIESGEHGRTVYRLYHQEFADYLREALADGD
jgi:hypothetical protein